MYESTLQLTYQLALYKAPQYSKILIDNEFFLVCGNLNAVSFEVNMWGQFFRAYIQDVPFNL